VGTETTQPPQPPRMPSRAPRGFLQAIFDQEAKEAKAPGDDAMATITVFDQKLRDELAYDAPEALRAAVDKVLAGRGETSTLPPFRHGLDLGCGTGSNGPLWRGLVSGAWVGVDVSRGMALAAWQRAKRKDKSSSPHSYDRVFEADIDDVFSAAPPAEEATGDSALLLLLLRNLEEREDDDDGGAAVTPSASESAALAAESSWGVVTATDTLIYVGDLRATFAAVSSRLAAPGGIFAVSLERFDDSDSESGWRLQGSGTYAHSKRHVMEAAEAAGLRVEHYDDAHSPRLERGAPVKGHLAIFSKP
jgi:predicted TPR repeat methyltransferase